MGYALQSRLSFGDEPDSGAEFSDCGAYRFRLWRYWSDKPRVCFLMLNPSVANEVDNDRTVRRCIGFAQSWGAGGLYVANIFALRSTDPQGLLGVDDPVGRGNNDHIAALTSKSRLIVCAWGTHSGTRLKALISERTRAVAGVLRRKRLHCLGTAKDGHPRHPLYLPETLKPVPWSLP